MQLLQAYQSNQSQSLEQFIPQIQKEAPKTSGENTSFLDSLRAETEAQNKRLEEARMNKKSEKVEKEPISANPGQKNQEVQKVEKMDSDVNAANVEVADSKAAEKTSKDEKVSKSDSKEESVKKYSENDKKEKSELSDSLARQLSLLNRLVQNQKKSNENVKNLKEVEGEFMAEKVTAKEIDWLSKTEASHGINIEDLTSADLDELLKNAENLDDLLKMSQNPEQLLQDAQELALESPKDFLAAAEKNAKFTAENARLDSKNDLNDKKDAKDLGEKGKKVQFTVHDFRTSQNVEDKNVAVKAAAKSAEKQALNVNYNSDGTPSVQMTLEMAHGAEQNITSANSQTASANGSTFQAMLNNAVAENAPEFVRAGNIVLKDGNKGSINLILHPEKLGNVKIALSLSDKVITGQITVHSQEAYEAFKSSIAELKAAFTQQGFEAGSFNLDFGGQNNQSFAQNGQNNNQQNSDGFFMASQSYGEFVTQMDSPSQGSWTSGGDYAVDIVA